MGYWTNNYSGPGADELHVGGKLVFDQGAKVEGLIANVEDSTAADLAGLKADFNALLTKMKDAGLIEPDAFTMTISNTVNDTFEGHADRQWNTAKISAAAESNGVITVTLSKKVSELKNFNAGGRWGTHKWLGIGVSAGINPITGLYYKSTKDYAQFTQLGEEDVTEATSVGLSAGYFVLWIAADLVLAGQNNKFTIKAAGHKETEFTLKIVEPAA